MCVCMCIFPLFFFIFVLFCMLTALLFSNNYYCIFLLLLLRFLFSLLRFLSVFLFLHKVCVSFSICLGFGCFVFPYIFLVCCYYSIWYLFEKISASDKVSLSKIESISKVKLLLRVFFYIENARDFRNSERLNDRKRG